jgi:hypothetical protein
MGKIMEMLKTMTARMEANNKVWREEMETRRNAWRKETTACQDAMGTNLKYTYMQGRMNDGHKEMMAWLKDLKLKKEETMACQEKTEARLQGEPTSEDMTPEVSHKQVVPLVNAVVMPVGEPRKRSRDQRHLAAQRRQKKEEERTQSKNGRRKNLVAARRGTTRRVTVAWRKRNILRTSWTQRNCGLQKKVTAAGIKVTRRAGVARRKSNFVRKCPSRDIVGQDIPKRRTEKNKLWKGPECENGVRDRRLKLQLRGSKQTKNPTTNNIVGWNPEDRAPLGSGGTRKKDICDIFREKIMEHVVGTSSGLRRREKWTLWRGRPPPKRKKKQH